jgi:Cu/Ag efflux protein CusF
MSSITRLGLVSASLLLALGLAVSPALEARGARPDYRGYGLIKGLDPEKGEITLDHGEIPGLMEAMTMTYRVSDPSMLEAFAPGQEVSFRLRDQDGQYVVTAIEPRGSAAPGETPRAGGPMEHGSMMHGCMESCMQMCGGGMRH